MMLIPYLDHGGIALGSSLGALFHTLFLFVLSSKANWALRNERILADGW